MTGIMLIREVKKSLENGHKPVIFYARTINNDGKANEGNDKK